MKKFYQRAFNILIVAAMLAGALGMLIMQPARATVVDPLYHNFPLYVSNYGSGTIQKINSDGVVTTFATGLSNPWGLAFDSSGNLYVANYGDGTIGKITPSGTVSTFASGFSNPSALAFDTNGDLYVASGYASSTKISKVTPAGAVSDFILFGTGWPYGLAIDSGGYVYITDHMNGKVRKVTPDGTSSSEFVSVFQPQGLAFDSSGNLYVSRVGGVDKYNSSGTYLAGFGGTLMHDMAFDNNGNLYVADAYYSVNSIYRADTSLNVTTFAAGFNSPMGLAFYPAPELAVKGAGNLISSGDTTPATADDTDFGLVSTSSSTVNHTFTIKNVGGADLSLTDTAPNYVSISGSSDFSITTQPASGTITPGGTNTFDVHFDPSSLGLQTATVSITNNDSAHNPYTFDVQGRGCVNAITVTNANDSGAGSLREALMNICDGGAITFDNNYTITLASTLPTVDKAITITGNGAANTIIQASDCNPITELDSSDNACTPVNYKIFTVGASGDLTLDGVTLQHASHTDDGGAIYSDGALTIKNSVVANNKTTSYGGAIAAYSGGSLTTTIINSTFSNNSADYSGAIYAENLITITNSTFSNNSANYYAGAVEIYGDATITNSTFTGNQSMAEGGGAIVYDGGGTMTIVGSTFTGNSDTNWGGGAILNYGDLIVVNSTLTNNSVGTGGYGGGIFNDSGATLTVINSTLAGNRAERGGAINLYAGTGGNVTLQNSILSGSTSDGTTVIEDCYNENSDTIAANTNSLIQTNGASGHMCGTPMLSGDPMLGALANNGGPTQTMALKPGSPAIDAGNNSVCADANTVNNKDQRGSMRPLDGNRDSNAVCDIGAYELGVASFVSNKTQDGWILESGETSNKGGTLNSIATTINLGDDGADRQYKGILSFDTSSLPNGAVITSAVIKVKRSTISGTNPFSTHGSLICDIKRGSFGTSALALGDFNATASMNSAGTFASIGSGWYSTTLNNSALAYINTLGLTQCRIRFTKDDNDDRGADILKIFSGNTSTTANRPVLIVEYYVP